MKLKSKLLALAALAFVGLAPSSALAYSYSAKLKVSASPSGAGTVYVNSSNSKPTKAQAESTIERDDGGVLVTFYVWAEANPGYEFVSWESDGCESSTSAATSYSLKTSTKDNGTEEYSRSAHFREVKTDSKTLTLNTGNSADAIWTPSDDFGEALTYSSDNTSVATVSADGEKVKITAAGNGTTTINASSSTLRATYTVTVQTRYYGTLHAGVAQGSGTVSAAETAAAAQSGTHGATASKEVYVDAQGTGQSKQVYVHATPASGYGFLGWSENGSDPANWPDNPDYFTLSNLSTDRATVSRTIMANFGELFTVTLNQATGGAASISSSTPAASGSTITEIKPREITATFTATPSSGNAFRRWAIVQGGETVYETANPLTKTFTSSATVTPEFKQAQSGVGTTISPDGQTWPTWTAAETLNAGATIDSITPADLLRAEIIDNKLVVTPGVTNVQGIVVTKSGTATIRIDNGDKFLVYEVTIEKPTLAQQEIVLTIDEEKKSDIEFPASYDVSYTQSSGDAGCALVYQMGDYVYARGVDRGERTVKISGLVYDVVYHVVVDKPTTSISLTKSIETCYLDTSASDATPRVFSDIASVTSSDLNVLTVANKAPYVEITTKSAGTSVVTVETHAVTYKYTITVQVTTLAEKTITIPTNGSFAEDFISITSFKPVSGCGTVIDVSAEEGRVSGVGLKPGDATFEVVGTIAGQSGYVCQPYEIHVYDGSQGHIDYGENGLSYTGAKSVTTVDDGTGDLLMIFNDPTTNCTFTIPDGYLARARVLAVGGGGAGGTESKSGNGAGGGGAGGYVEEMSVTLRAGTYYVGVGAGGQQAQAKINPVAGNNGGPSVITNALGIAVVNAMGGGGGATSLPGNANGIYGGSGGGAAWYDGEAGAAGPGLYPQGSYGAVPTVLNNGAGGGGAGGEGVATGAGGEGRATDITGTSVIYAAGGAGGRGDAVQAGAAGAGPGFGGEGGSGDFGGAGADGVVIVRLSSLKKIIEVPALKNGDGYYTDRFEWSEGATYTGFNQAAYNAKYQNAILYVDGVMSKSCTVEGGAIKGNGYYTFVVYLKEGYVWSDTKTDEGRQYGWRIAMPETTVDPTIAVNKWVEWTGDDAAVIHITSQATPEQSGGSCKVLFVGGMCGAHKQEKNTVKNAINAITEKGSVDYYLIPDRYTHTSLSRVSGSLAKGEKIADSVINSVWQSSDNHFIIDQIIEVLADCIVEGSANYKQYDYIVLEFDGNYMANGGSTQITIDGKQVTGERRLKDLAKAGTTMAVARAIKPYYDDSKVIWIIPDSKANVTQNDPVTPYYTPSSYYSGGGNAASLTEYRYYSNAAVLDPMALISAADNTHTKQGYSGRRSFTESSVSYYVAYTGTKTVSSVTVYPLINRNPNNQVYYNNSENVNNFLDATIQIKAYNISGKDEVKTNVGLDVTRVDVLFAPETGAETWDQVPANKWQTIYSFSPDAGASPTTVQYAPLKNQPKSAAGATLETTQFLTFTAASNFVDYAIQNLEIETWTKLDVYVHDDGTFKSSVGAVQNPVTGKWEKNPNYGSAKVAFIDEDGNETEVKGEAETSIPLTFDSFKLTGLVTNGEIFLNGMTNNPVEFSEGYSPTVSYRGDAGYALSKLIVDGHVTPIDSTNVTYVLFRNLASGHTVEAIYESVVGGVTSTPTNYVYDGTLHPYTMTLDDEWKVENPDENIKIVFAPSAGAADDKWLTEEELAAMTPGELAAFYGIPSSDDIIGVGEKRIYYRVMVRQPGWGESGSMDDWGWKLVASGSDTITITPAQLFSQPETKLINVGDPLPTSAAVKVTGFVNGEDESVLSGTWVFSSTNYVQGAGVGLYDFRASGKTAANYIITPHPGVLAVEKSPIYVNETAQSPLLDIADTGVARVEKVYDGVSTGLIATVTAPASGIALKWREGDTGEWSSVRPVYTDVGEYKVWFWVGETGGEVNYLSSSNYQYVVILPRPVTLESAAATKAFDGTALVTNEVFVADGSFADGEGLAEYECLARITEVGTLDNEFRYVLKDNTKAENYDIHEVYGLLEVTPARIVVNDTPQPDDPDPKKRLSPDENGVEPVVKMYDGIGTNIVLEVQKPKTGAKILYTLTPDDPASWAETASVVDVTLDASGRPVPVAVWYAIEDPAGNYAAVTNFQFVTITNRPATVTAGSASRPYDGTLLTCSEIGGTEGFVEGEGVVSMETTKASGIVNVGTAANVIASVEPAEGTKLSNYTLTYLPGELEVTKRPVTLTSPTKVSFYQPGQALTFLGSEITKDGFVAGEDFTYSDFASIDEVGQAAATFSYDSASADVGNYEVSVVEGTLILGKATIYIGGVEQTEGLDPETDETGVTPVDVVYDGEPHEIEVVVTYPTAEIRESTVRFSADGETWVDALPYVDACEKTKVWYSVTAEDFDGVTNYSYVTIHPRPVTVKADDATKPFDGTALVCGTFAVTEGEFAGDEGIAALAMTAASAQTEVGACSNVINEATVAFKSNTKAANYVLTYAQGELKVTQGVLNPVLPEIERTYDGTATNFEVTVSEIEDFEVQYSTDGGKTWQSEPPAFTDAGEYEVVSVVTDPAGNYAPVTNVTPVVIRPRAITVTVNPAQMKYGQPEPSYSAIITCDDNGEALVESEAAKIVYNIGPTGIKKVGENTLHASGEERQGNYRITYVDNILTIYDKDTIPYTLEGVEVTYDGEGHGLSAVIDPGAEGEFTIRYALSEHGPWYDSLLAVTNVSQDGGTPIWYAITGSDTYQAVTNVAIVKVVPKAMTITADDVTKVVDEADPALTVTYDGVVTRDLGHETELFVFEISRAPGEAEGEYEITPTGVITQGNYTVSYVKGTLTIESAVNGLWICDHADGGTNTEGKAFLHLAFDPGLGTIDATAIDRLKDKIYVISAGDEDGLKSAEQVKASLRGGTGDQDAAKGWIWITVQAPTSWPSLIKVVIQ